MSTRVFTTQPCSPGRQVSLAPEDVRHIALVLRMQRGDSITVVSDRVAWNAQLEEVRRDRVVVTILAESKLGGELPVEVIVVQAIPKGTKMDDVIEKVTELGASQILPVRCERSYGGDAPHKLERWRRIARSAAAQAQRLSAPHVEAAADLLGTLERLASAVHVLVAWERAPHASLASSLARVDARRSLAVVIGPEGSFTDAELSAAKRLHCDVVSLGSTTLRTETAAAAAIAAIAALRSWW